VFATLTAVGLYLEVTSTGAKRWFWRFRFEDKEKRIALGSYPEVKLREAREARDEARKLQRQGIDPVLQRRVEKLDNRAASHDTFEAVAREFHTTHKSGWSPHYGQRWIERMEKDLLPFIGPLPLAFVTAPLLLQTLKRVENRGASKPLTACASTLGRCSGTALPRAAVSAIRFPTFTAH
jgi:hypothetical protein